MWDGVEVRAGGESAVKSAPKRPQSAARVAPKSPRSDAKAAPTVEEAPPRRRTYVSVREHGGMGVRKARGRGAGGGRWVKREHAKPPFGSEVRGQKSEIRLQVADLPTIRFFDEIVR